MGRGSGPCSRGERHHAARLASALVDWTERATATNRRLDSGACAAAGGCRCRAAGNRRTLHHGVRRPSDAWLVRWTTDVGRGGRGEHSSPSCRRPLAPNWRRGSPFAAALRFHDRTSPAVRTRRRILGCLDLHPSDPLPALCRGQGARPSVASDLSQQLHDRVAGHGRVACRLQSTAVRPNASREGENLGVRGP